MDNNKCYDVYAKLDTLEECIKEGLEYRKNDFDNLEDCIEDLRDDRLNEIIDNNVDIYNWDLLQWVSIDFKHAGYIEEVIEEGLCNVDKNVCFFNLIMCGQYRWLEEHAYNYLRNLQEDSEYEEYRQSFEKESIEI